MQQTREIEGKSKANRWVEIKARRELEVQTEVTPPNSKMPVDGAGSSPPQPPSRYSARVGHHKDGD